MDKVPEKADRYLIPLHKDELSHWHQLRSDNSSQLVLPPPIIHQSADNIIEPSSTSMKFHRVGSLSPEEVREEFISIVEAVGDETVTLNVGGIVFKTYYKTLARWPSTRLFDVAHQRALDPDADTPSEIFYDRDPNVFASVLEYYRNGELHIPFNVCGIIVRTELQYWLIDENVIEKCCWDRYCNQVDSHRALKSLDIQVEELRHEKELIKRLRGRKLVQMRLWRLFFRPASSHLAMTYAVISIVFVMLSVVEFCLETQPGFYVKIHVNSSKCHWDASIAQLALVAPLPWLSRIDQVCSIFFAIDIIICFSTSPQKRHYASSPMTIVNVLSLIPTTITSIGNHIDPDRCLYHYRVVMEMILVLRILRIGRLFQVLYHFVSMRVMWIALRSSVYELGVLLTVSTVATFFFSTLIYYAEGKRDPDGSKFVSIPVGLWWSIVTITTVGYGDITPVTGLGFVVGAFCAMSGTILFALTIPVLSNNFALLYSHARSRERRDVHKDESLLGQIRVSLRKHRRRSHMAKESVLARALRGLSDHSMTREDADKEKSDDDEMVPDELSARPRHLHVHMSDENTVISFSPDDGEQVMSDADNESHDGSRSTLAALDELSPRPTTGSPSANVLKDESPKRSWRYVLARDEVVRPTLAYVVSTDELAPRTTAHDTGNQHQQPLQQQADDDDVSTLDDSDDTSVDMEDAVTAQSSLVIGHVDISDKEDQPTNPNTH